MYRYSSYPYGTYNFPFEEIFDLLREYWAKFDSFYISEQNKEYRKIYNWKNRKNKELTEEEKNRLNTIGYFDSANHLKKVKTLSFDDRYNELLAYEAKYNSIKISRHDKEHRQLFHWLIHIRRSRILTTEQKDKLKTLGVEVKTSKNNDEFSRTFDKRFEELNEYKRQFGTAHIKRTNEEYRQLYFWTSYIKRRASLTKEQIEKLKSIGFDTSGIEKYMASE